MIEIMMIIIIILCVIVIGIRLYFYYQEKHIFEKNKKQIFENINKEKKEILIIRNGTIEKGTQKDKKGNYFVEKNFDDGKKIIVNKDIDNIKPYVIFLLGRMGVTNINKILYTIMIGGIGGIGSIIYFVSMQNNGINENIENLEKQIKEIENKDLDFEEYPTIRDTE